MAPTANPSSTSPSSHGGSDFSGGSASAGAAVYRLSSGGERTVFQAEDGSWELHDSRGRAIAVPLQQPGPEANPAANRTASARSKFSAAEMKRWSETFDKTLAKRGLQGLTLRRPQQQQPSAAKKQGGSRAASRAAWPARDRCSRDEVRARKIAVLFSFE